MMSEQEARALSELAAKFERRARRCFRDGQGAATHAERVALESRASSVRSCALELRDTIAALQSAHTPPPATTQTPSPA
jgi:hypothetical protein